MVIMSCSCSCFKSCCKGTLLKAPHLTVLCCIAAVVSSGDWVVGVIGIPFALFSLVDLNSVLHDWSTPLRLLIILLYILAVAVGFGPTFYFPFRKKSFYNAWREWFVLNSLFWSLLRYPFTLYRYTVMASELPISNTAFVLKALLFGPHVITLMLGIGYPLRIDVAFPFTTLTGISAGAGCVWVHSKLLQSPAARPHLEFLARQVCSSSLLKKAVIFNPGAPCTYEYVLLYLWCAEGVLSVLLVIWVIVVDQSKQRKRFFRMTGLQEPYPFFPHSTLVAISMVLGVCLFYLLTAEAM